MTDSTHLAQKYASLNDAALLNLYRQGAAAFTSDAWQVLSTEVDARDLDPLAALSPVEAHLALGPSVGSSYPVQTAEAAIERANELLVARLDEAAIASHLVAAGVPALRAKEILETISQTQMEAVIAGARRQMRRGTIAFSIGVLITLASLVASAEAGGTVIITIGLIGYGIYDMWRAAMTLQQHGRWDSTAGSAR